MDNIAAHRKCVGFGNLVFRHDIHSICFQSNDLWYTFWHELPLEEEMGHTQWSDACILEGCGKDHL